jgi:hypothetical protein
MAELLGATVSMMLFGAVAAWIVRKLTSIAAIPSYVVGVGIMTVVGGWLYSQDGYHSFMNAWTIYLIGGVVALTLMIFGETRRVKSRLPGGPS